jgi:hypothetical protein
MKTVHFNELSMHDKVLLIEDLGQELCSIEHYDHRIYLYSFNSLLIEIYRNIESQKIERITVATYGDLDKFVSRITIRIPQYHH